MRGIPVVASDWSGSIDFLNSETGIPVPVRLIEATDPQRTYDHPCTMWAEPDVAVAAEALWELRNNPVRAYSLGQAAASFAMRVWSAENYVKTVRGHLGI